MARSVRSPSAYGLWTASGTAPSATNSTTSAPRTSKSRLRFTGGPSHLPDRGLAEHARGADGEREDEEDEPRRLAPAAPHGEARQALERAEEHADDDHAEARLEPGDDRHRERLEHERRRHRRPDGGDRRDEDPGERRDAAR